MTTHTLPLPAPVSTVLAPDASASSTFEGGVRGAPHLLLRLEGAILLAAAVLAYRHLGGSWGLFAALFLVPDVSMLGYLAGPRVGAALYNAGHALLGPALMGGLALVTPVPSTVLLLALIWTAHIGFDRLAGYGLKYGSGFFDTHLGRVGKKHPSVRS